VADFVHPTPPQDIDLTDDPSQLPNEISAKTTLTGEFIYVSSSVETLLR
jgi:hypothetical protein